MTPYPRAMQDFPRLRQSTLAAFDACPLTWHFDVLYGKSFVSAPSARGILWHRFFAKCFYEMARLGEERLEVDVAIAILNETLHQADVPDEEVVPCPMSEVRDLYWMAKKFAYETTWNIGNLVDVEQRLETYVEYPDPEGGSVRRTFSGQLDVLFAEGISLDRAIVVDAKTSWWLPPASDISEAGFFQQRAYALLVFANHSTINSVTLREFYPRYSQNREATLYRDQVDELREQFGALVERFDRSYERQMWHPTPGGHCSYCPRPTACPIFPTAKRRGRISSPEEASTVAAQVLVGEAAIKQGKEALKAWAAVHGPVPVRDAKANRVWGHRASKRTDRPTREQMERAIQTGETLDDLYRETIGTRFDIHIPKPELEVDVSPDLTELLERSVEEAQARRQEHHG